MIADWNPHKGINRVPVTKVPTVAPARSDVKAPRAEPPSSPMILVAAGNWYPQKKAKTKQYESKYN